MRTAPRARFPEGSLLAAMMGGAAPTEARRAARRLRAEGAPALAGEEAIAELARGLSESAVPCSPAVPDALPPLFWLETRREDAAGMGRAIGWVVERKGAGLAIRGFAAASGAEAVPELRGTVTLAYGVAIPEEDGEIALARGLIASAALPDLLSQMGEASPVLVMPAEPSGGDTELLKGFRLSVAMTPDAAPG